MAKNKIERIDQEIEKTREKIAEYQEKLKTLEAQKTEAENLEIVQMVRALRMTPAQLNAMLSGGMNHGRDTALSESNNQEVTAYEECSQTFSNILDFHNSPDEQEHRCYCRNSKNHKNKQGLPQAFTMQ